MRTLLAYAIVLPLSFLASRMAAIVIGAPMSFALIRASVWLRSTIVGFISCVGGVAAAVVFGWCVFNWVVGPGSFTIVPLLASVLILTVSISKDFRHSRECAKTQADFQSDGKQWMSDQIGNPWSTVVGDVCGLILAAAWFFLA